MKRSVIGGIASSVIASSALADPASSSTTSAADAKRQVLKLEREWTAAEIKRDAATLRRILDDRFIVTFGAGGYAEDAVWNAPGAPAAHGRTAIHEYFRKDMAASAAAGLTFKFDPVINVGVSANLG
jgi:hypothetical protein